MTLLVLRLLALFLLTAPLCAQAERPNVLFVLVDDLGWADLGCYGGTAVATPNLDALAAEGLLFTQAYSGSVVCAPARSTLMTGTHAGRTPVRLNTGGVPLRDEDVTVAEVLRDAGYRTAGFGKWGLGDLGTPGVPERQGFDRFYGYYHQIHAHYHLPRYLILDGQKQPLEANAGFYGAHARTGPFPRRGAEHDANYVYAPDAIADATEAFLREEHEAPFFCYAAWTPPHGEFTIPADDPAWLAVADEDWPAKVKVTAAFTAWIDRRVGQLLRILDERGLRDDTLVVFASDHGADERHEGTLDSCGPLRGAKRSVYEGGIRVPLLARWPGHVEPGSRSDHLTYFPDVLPTLADLAGVEAPPGLDGISLAPLLRGPKSALAQAQHAYLYWEWERYDWSARRPVSGGLMQAARVGRWKALRHATDAPLELYDVPADPGEQRDLAAERPELVAMFEAVLAAAREPVRPQAEPEMPAGRSYR